MFYYLYQITNLVNNKIYVGVHKTKDMNDGYMGSGKVIKRAIEKYGTDNFQKDILETFQDAKSMYAREKELVTEEFLEREDVYNLRRGGLGGFDYVNNNTDITIPRNRKVTYKRVHRLLNDADFRKFCAEKSRNALKNSVNIRNTKECKRRSIETGIEKHGSWNSWHKGSKRNDDVKKKMSISARGGKNSQFGTMWITNGLMSKKISKQSIIPDGWSKGRIVK